MSCSAFARLSNCRAGGFGRGYCNWACAPGKQTPAWAAAVTAMARYTKMTPAAPNEGSTNATSGSVENDPCCDVGDVLIAGNPATGQGSPRSLESRRCCRDPPVRNQALR